VKADAIANSPAGPFAKNVHRTFFLTLGPVTD